MSAYRFLAEFWVIVPVLMPYYFATGLDAAQAFTVQAVYSIAIVVCEIPSGYLADVVGRRTALLVGALFIPVGLSLYALAASFPAYILAEMVLAVGGSLRSGTDSAVLYDSLLQQGAQERYAAVEGKAELAARVGGALASVLGGALGLLSMKLPFYVNIVSGLAMVVIALQVVEPARHAAPGHRPLQGILDTVRAVLSQPRMRWLLLLSAVLHGTGVISVWASFLYYPQAGIPALWHGALFAGLGLLSGLGAHRADQVLGVLGWRATVVSVLAIAPALLLLGLLSAPAMVVLVYVHALLWGVSGPTLRRDVNQLARSETRATTLSVVNMGGSLAYALGAPLFGALVDQHGLPFAYRCLSVAFLLPAALAVWKLRQPLQPCT